MLSSEQIVKIIKDRDNYPNVIEIKETAKGEVQISVKVRDDTLDDAVELAIDGYNRVKKGLKKLK